MIKLSAIELRRGAKVLLDSADFICHEGERWGVIGRNGCGKSSLFSLLTGRAKEDAGSLSLPAGWTIAEMRQETNYESQVSALDYVLAGDRRYSELKRKLDQSDTLGDAELTRLLGEFEEHDGYRAPARAQTLLAGLGFLPNDAEKDIRAFSGGWQIRLNLAQALMCPSQLLLLDEPTNHLDLEACAWLERWLCAYQGTLLLISHDRDFLDAVTGHTLSFEQQTLVSYTGSYSEFERQRSERLALQQQAFEKQQASIRHMEDFVRRFKAKASKAKQAQSRVKALEKLERIAPAHVDSPFTFTFREAPQAFSALLQLDGATLGYGAKASASKQRVEVVKKASLELQPGDRIGLLGRNGAGKSTLLKTLAGDLALLDGERRASDNLRLGYFSQSQMDTLDIDASAMQHFERMDPNITQAEARRFLGSFNFHDDKVFEPVRQFSGGEKARLTLALIVWQNPNLLILDEPTNHLDLEMCHALTVALQDFAGAILLVSHDRHLIKNTVDRLILVADGRVREFDDSIEHYLARSLESATIAGDQGGGGKPADAGKKGQRQRDAELRKAQAPLRKSLRELETAMEKQQSKLQKLEAELADPELYVQDAARFTELSQTAGGLRTSISELEEEWLAVTEALEQAS